MISDPLKPSCYVFVEGLHAEAVICAVFQLDLASGTGYFRYGKSWLERADAFPLDPLHLPLSEQEFICRLPKAVFGVLSDAAPDSWGRKLMLSLHSTKPQHEVDFLLAGSGEGVGALAFSLSRHQAKKKIAKNHFVDLQSLTQSKNDLLAHNNLSAEAKKALEYGISMGGARPKSSVQDGDTLYLVKFNKADDLVNMARVEHATLTLAEQLGIRVAHSKVVQTGVEDVLLVERFDRSASQIHAHFISAESLFSEQKVSELSLKTSYGYPALAEMLRQYSVDPSDSEELYRRMLFNLLMGNTDDHGRNHALLLDLTNKSWRLSPAYDMVPVNSSRQHAMGVGDFGRIGTVENALSQCSRFGLKLNKARQIVAEAEQVVLSWPQHFIKAGVSASDIEVLKALIPN